MDSRGHMKYRPGEIIFPESTFISYSVEYLGRPYVILHPDPYGRNKSVVGFLIVVEFTTSRFLYGHQCMVRSFVSLISGVLKYQSAGGEGIHIVSHVLVVCLSTHCLADKENYTCQSGYDSILDRMLLFLTAVHIFLCISVHRSRYFPFGTIVHEDRYLFCIQLSIYRSKFLLVARGHYFCIFECILEYFVQAMYPLATFGLVHIEMIPHELLCDIVLEEIKNEIETVLYSGERAGLVNYRWSYTFAWLTVELVISEIFVMGVLEKGKKCVECILRHPCKGPESFGIVSNCYITHDNITDNCEFTRIRVI